MKIIAKTLLLGLIALGLPACWGSSADTSYERGQKFHQQKDYQAAIAEYQNHIDQRLAVTGRPDWENPYIYLLDIGDIYLEQGLTDQAIATYLRAEDKLVTKRYIDDRLRYVGNWYEENGRRYDAFAHLNKYKDRDPELFNLILDRLAKEIVKQEETR